MNVQQQNLNTVKSLLRQLFVKRSLHKLNQITKKKDSLLEYNRMKNPFRLLERGFKMGGGGEGGNGTYVE